MEHNTVSRFLDTYTIPKISMVKRPYISQYVSPNIVIVPTETCGPPLKKPKINSHDPIALQQTNQICQKTATNQDAQNLPTSSIVPPKDLEKPNLTVTKPKMTLTVEECLNKMYQMETSPDKGLNSNSARDLNKNKKSLTSNDMMSSGDVCEDPKIKHDPMLLSQSNQMCQNTSTLNQDAHNLAASSIVPPTDHKKLNLTLNKPIPNVKTLTIEESLNEMYQMEKTPDKNQSKASWASNYMMSIGEVYKKPIKLSLSSSKNSGRLPKDNVSIKTCKKRNTDPNMSNVELENHHKSEATKLPYVLVTSNENTVNSYSSTKVKGEKFKSTAACTKKLDNTCEKVNVTNLNEHSIRHLMLYPAEIKPRPNKENKRSTNVGSEHDKTNKSHRKQKQNCDEKAIKYATLNDRLLLKEKPKSISLINKNRVYEERRIKNTGNDDIENKSSIKKSRDSKLPPIKTTIRSSNAISMNSLVSSKPKESQTKNITINDRPCLKKKPNSTTCSRSVDSHTGSRPENKNISLISHRKSLIKCETAELSSRNPKQVIDSNKSIHSHVSKIKNVKSHEGKKHVKDNSHKDTLKTKSTKYDSTKKCGKSKINIRKKTPISPIRIPNSPVAKDTFAQDLYELKQSIPIKSVVQVKKTYEYNTPLEQPQINEIFDLRSKLSRRIRHRNKNYNKNNEKDNKRENLIISVEHESNDEDVHKKSKKPKDDNKKSSPKLKKTKTKIVKFKKIQLVINVIKQVPSSSDTDNISDKEEEDSSLNNSDLSFLDDFNVDEIIDTLNHCEYKTNNKKHNLDDCANADGISREIESVDKENKNNFTWSAAYQESIAQECNTRHKILKRSNNEEISPPESSIKIEVLDESPNAVAIIDESDLLDRINSAPNFHDPKSEHDKYTNGSENAANNPLLPTSVENSKNEAAANTLIANIKIEPDEEYVWESVTLAPKSDNDELTKVSNTENSDTKIVHTKERHDFHDPNTKCDKYTNSSKNTTNNSLSPLSVQNNKEGIDTSSVINNKPDAEIYQSSTSVSKSGNYELTKIFNKDNSLNVTVAEKPDTIDIINIPTSIKLEPTETNTNSSKPYADVNLSMLPGILHNYADTKQANIKNELTNILEKSVNDQVDDSDKDSIASDDTLIIEKIDHPFISEVNLLDTSKTFEISSEFNNNVKTENDYLISTNNLSEIPKTSVTILQSEQNLNAENDGQDTFTSDKHLSQDSNKVLQNCDDKESGTEIVLTPVGKEPATKNILTKSETCSSITHPASNDNTKALSSANNTQLMNTSCDKKHTFINNNKMIAEKLENRMLEYLNRKFTVTCLLHEGKFSKIFCCNDIKGQKYAVKTSRKECQRYQSGILKERMLKMLQKDVPKENFHCIHIFNGFGIMGHWCFLMEYYPKNLKQALTENKKAFHIDLVQVLSKQLVAAVTLLRNNNIVHSDIKPGHILMNCSNDRLKICGFDAAYYIESANLLPNVGTAPYRAPEIILGYSAGFSIDVWSTALVIYEMLTNSLLFPGTYNNDILYKHMSTFGNIPNDMIDQAIFRNNHFMGPTFKRRVGIRGQNIIYIERFNKTLLLRKSIFTAYYHYWGNTRTKFQKSNDLIKLKLLIELLEQMLCLHPGYRLGIEFAFANPFIY